MRHIHQLCKADTMTHFNPRTPYGMRLYNNVRIKLLCDFNPRTPYGMRHRHFFHMYIHSIFQSTHPLRDATCNVIQSSFKQINFNPRTPYGMRLLRSHSFLQRAQDFNPRTPYGMRPSARPCQRA